MPGLLSLGGSASLLDDAADDSYEVTDERAGYLSELIAQPMDYNQRFVERLSFVPTGGQRWERTLQIQLPAGDRAIEQWWIVPLGPFNRRRFPDITVVNAAGEPLNLVTRKTHGLALTKAILVKQVFQLGPSARDALKGDPSTGKRLDDLYDQMSNYFTETTEQPITISEVKSDDGSVASDVEVHPRVKSARELLRSYKALWAEVVPADDMAASIKSFTNVVTEAIDTTQYLCWARARPGEVINLRVSHTVSDPRHSLRPKGIPSLVRAMVTGLLGVSRDDLRKEATDWYRQFGLVPIGYGFNIPTHRYTASYYSTLEPPARTDLTYLDWEVSNSYDEGEHSEVTSSLHSMHLYNADAEHSDDERPPSIRAYLRCLPHHHKQILGAALLNIVIVWLLAEGRLPGRPGDPLQGILIAAPSVVIAFLAQQQQHYYAHALRLTRAILWGYLFVAGIFLIAVAFSGQDVRAGGPDFGPLATAAAWLLAVASAAIFVWHFPLGPGYDRMIRWRFRSKWKLMKKDEKGSGRLKAFSRKRLRNCKANQGLDFKWQFYEAAYEQYARWIWRAVVLSIILMLGVLIWRWDPLQNPQPPQDNVESKLAHSPPQPAAGGSLRITSEPG